MTGPDLVSPCPSCGIVSSEDYDGCGSCFECHSETLAVATGLAIHRADLSKSVPPRWAWQDRLVIAYLNLLIGNEGVGKGTLMAWTIARLTRGDLPGDLAGKPVGVGVLGDEDSFADVWVPRLHAADADLSKVVQIERPDGGFVNVAEDREKLTLVVREYGLGLLFFDQLLDNLGAGTDDWRQKAVREALQPIRVLARELEIVALGSLHPNKRADSFRQLVSGAAAFNAVSRSSMLLAQHPEDEMLRVLCRGKGNLSKAPESVEFRIDEHRFSANGHHFAVPLAANFVNGTLTVDDLIGTDRVREEHSKVADACEVIEALLPRDGNWHPAKPIKEACDENGLDDRTAKRGKERLGIEHRRTTTFPAATEWRWPTSQDALRTHASAVPSVPSVPSAIPLDSASWDRQDTQDSQNTSPDCGPTVADIAQRPGESYEQWEARTFGGES